MDKINGIEIKLFILEVSEDNEKYQYEYPNLKHAQSMSEYEKTYTIYALGIDNKYYYVESK